MAMRIEDIRSFGVSQIGAAADTAIAIKESPNVETDASLFAVRETDVFRLRRGLCLPSSSATCINGVLDKRAIGETHNDADITLGDIYRILLPFHNQKNLSNGQDQVFTKPWFVVTENGDMYHQAMIAVANGFNVQAQSIIGIQNVERLREFVLTGGKVALSLDNTFVIDKTLDRDPEFVSQRSGSFYINIDGRNGNEFRKFEEGRHVVSIIGIDGEDFLIHDSFGLPNINAGRLFMALSAEEINPYLNYKQGGVTRGIVFAKGLSEMKDIEDLVNPDVFIPKDAVSLIQKLR